MLKRSLLILTFLAAIPGYSMADAVYGFKGKWLGVISTSVAGYIPGANVEYTLLADTMDISVDGTISGTALSSSTGKPIRLSGNVDSAGDFNLSAVGVDNCQASGKATLNENRVEFIGNGTCTVQQRDGTMKTVYQAMSSILTKVEPN